MADPERLDVDSDPDLDPTFQADADPKFVKLGRTIFFLPNHFFLLHNLTKLVMCNFLSNNAGGWAIGVRDKV